ncbi:hypothetical protein L9W92_17515 [Pelotomaculum terephthalicicum JT]|nr:hypothetical protein [Pelotomaculum terephthalicicum]MCG9969802.1 hypothetical protein [Pelotomaculum terephthalicicum JT]
MNAKFLETLKELIDYLGLLSSALTFIKKGGTVVRKNAKRNILKIKAVF